MPSDPDKPHRRSIRLPEYDYTWPGGYFVTICAYNHCCVFGEITDSTMRLNRAGVTVSKCWECIPDHFPGVTLGDYTVMPNHFHGIIVVGATHASPSGWARHASPLQPTGPWPRSIGAIVGSFKSAVTKRVNKSRRTPGALVWQRNYYERVIRDDEEMGTIREYIRLNPAMWDNDEDNPANQP